MTYSYRKRVANLVKDMPVGFEFTSDYLLNRFAHEKYCPSNYTLSHFALMTGVVASSGEVKVNGKKRVLYIRKDGVVE